MAENVEIISSDGTESVAEVEMDRAAMVAELVKSGYAYKDLAEMEDAELEDVYNGDDDEEGDDEGESDNEGEAEEGEDEGEEAE